MVPKGEERRVAHGVGGGKGPGCFLWETLSSFCLLHWDRIPGLEVEEEC